MKNFKRVLSLILILALIIPNMVFANELSEENGFRVADERMALVKEMLRDREDKGQLTLDHDVDDVVRIIVELNEKPVIVHGTESGQRYEDMSYSQKSNIESELYAAQEAVKSSISARNIDMSFGTNYTTVFNGFSGQVKFQEIELIEAIRGVKKVYISNEYQRPLIEPNMKSSHDMIESEDVWHEDVGYKGEGTVVAIIDTGIDPSHKDFVLSEDTEPKLSESDLGGKSLLGKYFTEKVPYGYNYYDLSDEILDLGPDASMHGMHVAGTVTANGEIKGVAPESQVLAMKVFSNDPMYATTFDDIYLVAIEEAIKLNADVLNMSLGSTASFYRAESAVDTAITNATEHGIVASISAGNSAYTGDGYNFPDKEDPDYGVVGAPSLSKDSISVASIENENMAVNYLQYEIPGVAEVLPTMSVIIVDEAYTLAAVQVRMSEAQKKFIAAKNSNLPIYLKITNAIFNDADGNRLVDLSVLPKTVTYTDDAGNVSQRSVLPGGTTGEGETVKAPMTLAGPYVLSEVFSGQEVEFVGAGIGAVEDFENIDVNGKIAFIIRGALPFTEKIENAEAAGAVGAIIYNSESGGEELINMAYPGNGGIPAGFIGYSYGVEALGLEDKFVKFPEGVIEAPNTNAGKMSDFSSWGTTPTLELKPEITTPGGMIYSTLQNDSYGMMSGTSMAAPHLSGGAALVMQHIKDKKLATELGAQTKLAKALLMNTAEVVMQDEINVVYDYTPAPYSPRKQGAGLMKLKSAVTTPVYVVDNSDLGSKGQAKVELKDFDKTSFTIDLKAINLTGNEVAYNVDVNAFRDIIHPVGLSLLASEAVEFELSGDRQIVVPPTGEKEFTVTVDFTGDANVYRNMFIEGWVTLTDASDTHPTLNVPYVGFYGNWDEPRILDDMRHEENSYYGAAGMVDTESFYYGGTIAFSPGTEDGEWYGTDTITPVVSLLRNAEKVEYNILDEYENKVRSIKAENFVRKNYLDGGRFNPYSYSLSRTWDGTVRGKIVEDGLYNFEIRTKVQNGGWQQKLVPFYVDTVGPEVTNIEYDEETGKLTWTAVDATSGTLMIFIDINGRAVDIIDVEKDEEGNLQTEFELDVKALLTAEGDYEILITAYDNALNEGEGSCTISVDKEIPYIYLTSPDLLEIYNENVIEVKGYVLKNNEITSIKVDDVETAIVFDRNIIHEGNRVSGYRFATELTLADGVNIVKIEAESLAGTKASIARRFYIDTEAPKFDNVVIVDRDEDSKTVDLEITMKDNFPVLDLYVYDSHEFSFDGSDTALNMEPAEETITVTVDLDLGVNNIPLRLVDAAGNDVTQSVSVNRKALTAERTVELDKAALEIVYSDGDKEDSVTQDVGLSNMGENGSFITWESSHEDIVSKRGKVTTPAFDTVVTLTATLSSGDDVTETKVFTVTVKGEPAPPVEGAVFVGYGKLKENVEENYVAYVQFDLKDIFKEYDLKVKLNGVVLEQKEPVEGYGYRFEGYLAEKPSEVIININGVDGVYFDVTEFASFELKVNLFEDYFAN